MNRISALLVASLAVLSAVAAANAATREEQTKACRRDALHFCIVDVPNREKIIACMKRHLDELSPACRAMFGGGKKGDANANNANASDANADNANAASQ
ncbi:hypothetical protein SAMN05444172_6296 [Burkholderia sp. GAS332]|jgi:hypothetical protein|uniref:hypothetical protein n=1 Tax=Paraburkholderia TaxID=1822464 RepID=UPI00092711D8|nr:hypothetical protein SAMN05444172_6296 [Burkholderia sp. GAS332]